MTFGSLGIRAAGPIRPSLPWCFSPATRSLDSSLDRSGAERKPAPGGHEQGGSWQCSVVSGLFRMPFKVSYCGYERGLRVWVLSARATLRSPRHLANDESSYFLSHEKVSEHIVVRVILQGSMLLACAQCQTHIQMVCLGQFLVSLGFISCLRHRGRHDPPVSRGRRQRA